MGVGTMEIHGTGRLRTDGTFTRPEDDLPPIIADRLRDGLGVYLGVYGRTGDGRVVFERLSIDRRNRDDVLQMVGVGFDDPHGVADVGYATSGGPRFGTATVADAQALDVLRDAERIGREHGQAAASWAEIDEETAQKIDEDGWGEVFGDMSGPLSGEWADGYSVWQLAVDCGIEDPYAELGDGSLANAYEEAYWSAFGDEIERKVETMRGPTLELDEDAAYKVAGWEGVGFRYVGQTFGGRARMVMIGDDKEWLVDAEDVETIGDNDYCASCGQIGCEADGRDRT